MSATLVVAGGTVAALAAADAAARAGRPVELLLPRKGAGGGFAPITVGGRRLDRGVRMLELHWEGVGASPPLAAYEPELDGHRPYARLLHEWVAELVGDRLVELPRPRMWAGGRMGAELHWSTDAAALRDVLDARQADAVAAETWALCSNGAGAAGLLAPEQAEELWRRPFADASVANHGPTFHRLLIEPLLRKIRPEGGDDVPARLRRKVWMPLFWPQTLWQAASGEPLCFRPERPFHTVEPGGPGALVDALLARLDASPLVSVERVDGFARIAPARAGAVTIELADGTAREAERPVLGLSPGELFTAAGVEYAPERVHSVLCWLDVAEDDLLELPSMLHVVDADLPVFRLTPGERDARTGRRVLTVELPHGIAKDDAFAAALAGLERAGVLRPGARADLLAAFAGRTFTAPTADSAARFAAARASYLERGIDAEVVGGGASFAADAFNDQVLQGLRAAAAATG